jgi:hypothetical protein
MGQAQESQGLLELSLRPDHHYRAGTGTTDCPGPMHGAQSVCAPVCGSLRGGHMSCMHEFVFVTM